MFEWLPEPEPSRGSFGGTWEMVDPGNWEGVDHHVRDTGVANNFTNPRGLFSGDIRY